MPPISLLSNGDFSTRQYQVVKVVGTTGNPHTFARTTAPTDVAIGIVQNDPTSSQAGEIAVAGEKARAEYGGTVTNGNLLSFGSDSRVLATASPTTAGGVRCLIAVALEDGVSGEVHDVFVVGPSFHEVST